MQIVLHVCEQCQRPRLCSSSGRCRCGGVLERRLFSDFEALDDGALEMEEHEPGDRPANPGLQSHD